jgi:outer membrane lipase/esterase
MARGAQAERHRDDRFGRRAGRDAGAGSGAVHQRLPASATVMPIPAPRRAGRSSLWAPDVRPELPTCRFTGSTNFVDTLQTIYHLPPATNYAIGGARTDDSNTLSGYGLNDGFKYELDQFAGSGTHSPIAT